jgi:hypothetical protein
LYLFFYLLFARYSRLSSELIQGCWAQDPEDRPSILYIVETLKTRCLSQPILDNDALWGHRIPPASDNLFVVHTV